MLTGGESLTVITSFFDTGDDKEVAEDGIKYYLNQDIVLASYGNSASINLGVAILTPQILRQLADEIENEWNKENTK